MALIKRRNNEPFAAALEDAGALITAVGNAAVANALEVYADFAAERKAQALTESRGGEYYRNALTYLGQAYSFAGDILCALSGCTKEEFAAVIPELAQHPQAANKEQGYTLFLQYLDTCRKRASRQVDYDRWDEESKKEKKKKDKDEE